MQPLPVSKHEQATEAVPSIKPLVRNTKKEILRQKARRQFMEGISFSGLLELYYAPSIASLFLWIFALLAAFGLIIYHSYFLLQLYFNARLSYEFIQTDKEVIPFPKVTICSLSGVNKTWASQHLIFPPKEKKVI